MINTTLISKIVWTTYVVLLATSDRASNKFIDDVPKRERVDHQIKFTLQNLILFT